MQHSMLYWGSLQREKELGPEATPLEQLRNSSCALCITTEYCAPSLIHTITTIGLFLRTSQPLIAQNPATHSQASFFLQGGPCHGQRLPVSFTHERPPGGSTQRPRVSNTARARYEVRCWHSFTATPGKALKRVPSNERGCL